jgi:molybdopterin molybdotransferase
MPEFFNVQAPDKAKDLLLSHTHHRTRIDKIDTFQASGRITSSAIFAPHDLPTFNRSAMDGYAVKASDTFGASGSLPAVLNIVGEISMGSAATANLAPGEGVIIHTGGMIPPDADAVVQIEHTQTIESKKATQLPFEIEVFRPVAVGQNILLVGEDVQAGDEILPAGHYLRAQDIGGLLALGITEIQVSAMPRVAIIATGDEIIEPSEPLAEGQIRDINSYTIASLVSQNGGSPDITGIVKDNFHSLLEASSAALKSHDMLVITAGSSVSVRDLTVQVIDRLGDPGVLLHGVATRPGKPTVVGAVGGKPILGLPGNPVSAMVQFLILGLPALFRLQGALTQPSKGSVRARLSQNVASASGREDYVPTRLIETSEGLVAEPVFGKSNLIYTLVKANGLLKVSMNRNGYETGEWVEVLLF